MTNSDDQQIEPKSASSTAGIGRLRVAIGLLQGIAAWWLLRLVAPSIYRYPPETHDHARYWAEQHPMIFAALALVTAFVPAIAIVETCEDAAPRQPPLRLAATPREKTVGREKRRG